MFEREGENYFHGQWLQHGSQTVVQEAAHPSVLFSMIECNDLHLKTIVSKCNTRTFEPDDDLPLPDYDPRNENSFVCG
jgi:DNA (cytosine-5)-methyltransferase 1